MFGLLIISFENWSHIKRKYLFVFAIVFVVVYDEHRGSLIHSTWPNFITQYFPNNLKGRISKMSPRVCCSVHETKQRKVAFIVNRITFEYLIKFSIRTYVSLKMLFLTCVTALLFVWNNNVKIIICIHH